MTDTTRSRGPVVVDTGVFAAELTRSGTALAELYRPVLEGRNVFVSFVTEAEVRFGARLAGWGQPRMRRLEQRLATVEVVWPGPDLVEEYADLRTWCVSNGHGWDRRRTKRIGGSTQRRGDCGFRSSPTMGSSAGSTSWKCLHRRTHQPMTDSALA